MTALGKNYIASPNHPPVGGNNRTATNTRAVDRLSTMSDLGDPSVQDLPAKRL
jgi:hypothetical protein